MKPLHVVTALMLGAACAAAQVPVPVATSDDCPRAWAEAEYLLWWFKGQPIPLPLVTAAPPTSAAVFPGAIGNADTSVLLGNQSIDSPAHSGFRLRAGMWLNDSVGVEAGYFKVFNETVNRQFAGLGTPTSPFLANPVFNPVTLSEETINAAGPNDPGLIAVYLESRLQGAELNGTYRLLGSGAFQADLLGGFRWLSLDERLAILNNTVGGFDATDSFETRNDFYGGQVGVRLRWEADRFFVAGTAKVALGNMHENVRIDGVSLANQQGVPQPGVPPLPGGVYTGTTNIGSFSRDRFAVVPEFGLKVGARLTDRLFATVGYDFLWLSDAARPGNAIDRVVNPTAFGGPVVGPARPQPTLRNDSFFAHGLTFGLGLSF